MEQLQLFFILAYCLRKGNESSLYRIPFFSYNKNSCSFERRISMTAKEELQDEVPRCEFIHAHPETIKAVEENMPAEEELYALSELFKIFADSTRIRILYVLLEHEMCVCDLAQLLNMTQSAISHQLRILKQSRLVKFRREGKTIFYSLLDEHVHSILSQGMEHITESKTS